MRGEFCPKVTTDGLPQTGSHSDEFRWNGNIAPGLGYRGERH
mgnify:CR=1 FL=1